MRMFEQIVFVAMVSGRDIAHDSAFNPSLFGTKRYTQLKDMFVALYSEDEFYDFYGYGCYCLSLGDRPMSANSFQRQPVDEKDSHCYQYALCNKCAKIDNDHTCISEMTNYGFNVDENSKEITCKNKSGCKRSICECDKAFVLGAAEAMKKHKPENSIWNEPHRFDYNDKCTAERTNPASKGVTMQCCGAPGHRVPYNDNHTCCPDGIARNVGTC